MTAAPTTTLTLPSTTAGDCQSGVMPPPSPMAVSTLRCSRTSSSVTPDLLCSHDVQQSAAKLDSCENLLINDVLSDSLADSSLASTVTSDIGSDLQSPGSVIQPDSEPDSFSFDNSGVSNYHITDLFSCSFTNQCSTPLEHNSLAISSPQSPTKRRFSFYFPRFWTCNVRGGLSCKTDEIAEIMFTNAIDVAVLVETWLHWGIHDDSVLCSIDLSKTFDKMNHHGLFIKLMERHIPANLLLLLENWFAIGVTCVKWDTTFSGFVRLLCGIRQGGTDRVQDLGVGC